MKKIYITFGGKAYDGTTKEIVNRAPQFGADEVWVYDDRWLIQNYPELLEANRWLFNTSLKFGFGWLFWKPFIILDALRRLDKGDVVLYTDADTYPIADLTCLFEACNRDGVFIFEAMGCENDRFTRKDCFIAMGMDDPKYFGCRHACGRFQLFRAGHAVGYQMLMEWYAYAINPMCQLREPSRYGLDLPGYARHSNEQSILTMLAHKYGIPLHREACQFGWPPAENSEDKYPQLFHQQYCEGNRSDVSGSAHRNMDARF